MQSSFKSLWLLPFVIAVIFLNQNCSGLRSTGSDSGDNNTSGFGPLEVIQLAASTYTLGPDSWPYKLIKLKAPDGTATYVHWVPPLGGSQRPAPAVLVTDPYSGISWSDDAIDKTWAMRPGAASGYSYPDVNGPGYISGITQNIHYQVTSPEFNMATWYPIIKNGMGLLVVSGRFYNQGNLSTYNQAVIQGLRFLAQEPTVDHGHIGIFGISLGGFEAIYAAGAAEMEIMPHYGVAWAPPTNWQSQATYTQSPPSGMTIPSQKQAFQNFFEPYVRRMKAVTHGFPGDTGADFSSLIPSAILPRLKTHFLILHDDWDTLVPSSQSRAFVSAAGNQAEGLWFPHQTPIDYNQFSLDHQQSSEGLMASTSYLFTYAYFLNHLVVDSSAAQLYALYANSDISKQFSYFRQQQLAGHDVSGLVPRLIELCDPRLVLLETSGGATVSGAQYVASILQTYWGLNASAVNATNVKAYLQSQGLPP